MIQIRDSLIHYLHTEKILQIWINDEKVFNSIPIKSFISLDENRRVKKVSDNVYFLYWIVNKK